MMTEQKSDTDEFYGKLDAIYREITGSDALSPLRVKAWEKFQQLGLPQRKHELFRYLNLRRLYSISYEAVESTDLDPSDISPYVLKECANSLIVFENGFFRPTLSRTGALPSKMQVMTLSDAMRTYGALITNQWLKSVNEEEDSFVALNGACHSEGAFIYLPPKLICEVPLQLLYLINTDKPSAFISPRLHFFAAAQSSIGIAATYKVLLGQKLFVDQVTEVSIEENAHVHFSQVNAPVESDIYHFDALRANLKRNSSIKTVSMTNGSMAIRNDYKVALSGENSSASLNGVWMLKEKREAHCHVFMDHRAPNCTSNQLYKGVLHDSSHSSFDGKIIVQQQAQKTNAFQLNNNLLLDDGAMADSSPNLKIYADDVKASHGATVGRLPEEELFYMRTRGLSEAEAKEILIAGFCQEILDMLPAFIYR